MSQSPLDRKASEQAPSLSQINVFPVKSVGGIALSSAWVEKQGLTFDRRFMLALADGSMVTARKYPKMVKVSSSLLPDGLIFTYEDKAPLRLKYANFKMQEAPATVWKDSFTAYTTCDEADDWFSDVLGVRVELLFSGEQSNRVREKLGHNVSFADGYPMLIISQASLDELNRRSPETHSMDQFRTNFVVSNTEAFAEDGWKRIRIGEVEFEVVKPCERCILTTVDVNSGELRATKEPLNTFSKFRANNRGGVFFGQNLVAKNEGLVRAGDVVEVLETKEKELYEDTWVESLHLTCVEREEIARDFTTFWLEPAKENHSLPSYQPGQHLPIEMVIDGEKVSRRYTLSSSPSRAGRLAISVKRVNDGQISNWLNDHFQVGDTLVAQNPDGAFYLEENPTQPLLLLSAGSGITPMLSMLRYLADHGQINDVVFYHQCSSEEDIPYQAEIDQIAKEHEGLSVIYSLSQPTKEWEGLSGRLSVSHVAKIEALHKRQAFVCGPGGFMDNAKKLLTQMGLNPQHYHQEAFSVAQSTEETVKQLQLSVNGYLFEGNNQSTLLEQAESAGVSIASSCRAGFCGACKVTLESGQVHQPDVPALQEHERNMGQILACCSVPQTDIEVVD
ncbi:hybrid-cluster NAD(P)-dependent oxidoreductase [Vibrio sp. Isolate31]|uniref:MOSC N-terminal beta barrel domain-containing protein n=1 Tax=unclassified Vibrio TaxID=2614977 RepID=UPI001EFE411D|nr:MULTISPECIES: hybrid-cluster NAD(P)-dependent oxidoreductase [unclassified Vibrio]MCG9555387.1 hybrid-cluster NAD(P)-dependent oxidoreductase [Vibrio sp. Isolate32]MCG9601060.1 hybrid-cluster NAD(P)-dependent oxidoreductase [Vibrio sp. Isolate31]